MFKLFKKYAVLDTVEANDYETYCMYEQIAGGYAGSLYDAEQELLTTYYKSKTTKLGMKKMNFLVGIAGFGVLLRKGFLFSVFENEGSIMSSIGVRFVILRSCWIHTAQFQATKVYRALLRRSGLFGKKFLTVQVL